MDRLEEVVFKEFKDMGIEATIVSHNLYGYGCHIDTSEHDKRIRAEAFDECIRTIVNTPTKIKVEHYRENDVLVDRQNEIIDMLEQLKGAE